MPAAPKIYAILEAANQNAAVAYWCHLDADALFFCDKFTQHADIRRLRYAVENDNTSNAPRLCSIAL